MAPNTERNPNFFQKKSTSGFLTPRRRSDGSAFPPQTPFYPSVALAEVGLFARLLGLRPEIFLRGYKIKG